MLNIHFFFIFSPFAQDELRLCITTPKHKEKLIVFIMQSNYLMPMASLSSGNLDAFYMTAQLGNFTKAANRLHITQSALSQRIINLEEELETTLFIRDRKGVRLTEAGQKLLQFCQQKDALEDQFFGELKLKPKNALSGMIRIGSFSSVMRSAIVPALVPLLQEHSQLKLSLLTKELGELPALLKKGEVDFLILNYKWEKEEIISISLGKEQNVLVEKRDYSGPEIFLDHDEEDETTLKYLRLRGKGNTHRLLNRRYMDDVYGIIDGVKLGLGRAIVPLHLIKNDKKIRILHPSHALHVPVFLHYYQQPFYTKLQEAVIQALTSECSRLLV